MAVTRLFLAIIAHIPKIDAPMSRNIIISLTDGELDTRTPECQELINQLRRVVRKSSKEWLSLLGRSSVSASENWQTSAVMDLLAHLLAPGPNGGSSPARAMRDAMMREERKLQVEKPDDEWMAYFITVCKNEQSHYLDKSLHRTGDRELRSRLMKALKLKGLYNESSDSRSDDFLIQKAVKELGQRTASGSSRHHDGLIPTEKDLSEMIADVTKHFPDAKWGFPQWISIAKGIFQFDPCVGLQDQAQDLDLESAHALEIPDPKSSAERGEWSASAADVLQLCQHLESSIATLDKEPFPTGKHGRTFVEYLLFSESRGKEKITQQEYANRRGIADSTIANWVTKIKHMIIQSSQNYDKQTILGALHALTEKYLPSHREIFPD
jgi:hypothetical protein